MPLNRIILACFFLLGAHPVHGETAEEAFAKIHQIVTADHRRCTNCHGARQIPRVGEKGDHHPFQVTARLEQLGMKCHSCHG